MIIRIITEPKSSFLLLAFLLIAQGLLGQSARQKGDQAWAMGKYKTAINNYSKVKNIGEDKELLAKRGLGYFKLNQLARAINDFTLSKKLGNEDPRLFFLMGQAKHHQNEYEEAAYFYKQYVKEAGEKNQETELAIREIKNCAFAAFHKKDRATAFVESFGNEINTYYDEVYSVQSQTFGNSFYFSSNRNLADNDVFAYSLDEKGKWNPEKLLTKGINSKADEYVMDVSSDGRSMLYISKAGLIEDHRIYVSTWDEKDKQHIIELPRSVLLGAVDLQLVDSNTIAFASKELGGLGGYDIFIVNYKNGRWSNPIHQGDIINSEYDDRSPFFASTMQFLYFSTNRPYCYGGFDIYYYNLLGMKEKPTNVGLPLNSSGNDLHFRMSEDGQLGVMSSDRKTGEGAYDIYQVFMQDFKPMPALDTMQLEYVQDYLNSLKPKVPKKPKTHLDKLKEKINKEELADAKEKETKEEEERNDVAKKKQAEELAAKEKAQKELDEKEARRLAALKKKREEKKQAEELAAKEKAQKELDEKEAMRSAALKKKREEKKQAEELAAKEKAQKELDEKEAMRSAALKKKREEKKQAEELAAEEKAQKELDEKEAMRSAALKKKREEKKQAEELAAKEKAQLAKAEKDRKAEEAAKKAAAARALEEELERKRLEKEKKKAEPTSIEINKVIISNLPQKESGESPLNSIEEETSEEEIINVEPISGEDLKNTFLYQDIHDLSNDINSKKLDELIKYLQRNKKHRVDLIAHTDHLEPGLEEYMLYNTLKRANLIAAKLMEQNIDQSRIGIESVMSNFPVVKKRVGGLTNEKYLAYNKRIDFEIRNEDKVVLSSLDMNDLRLPSYAQDRRYELFSQLRDEVYYSIQIASSDRIFKNAVLRLYDDIYIKREQAEADNSYYVGIYNKYEDAVVLQKNLEESSAPFSKIVAFYNGQLISKKDLKKLAKDYPDLKNFAAFRGK